MITERVVYNFKVTLCKRNSTDTFVVPAHIAADNYYEASNILQEWLATAAHELYSFDSCVGYAMDRSTSVIIMKKEVT